MAESEVIKTMEINLKLSVKEAHYLKGLMQNSIGSFESSTETSLRESIFKALPSFQELRE